VNSEWVGQRGQSVAYAWVTERKMGVLWCTGDPGLHQRHVRHQSRRYVLFRLRGSLSHEHPGAASLKRLAGLT
jgi:hypothetical protein